MDNLDYDLLASIADKIDTVINRLDQIIVLLKKIEAKGTYGQLTPKRTEHPDPNVTYTLKP